MNRKGRITHGESVGPAPNSDRTTLSTSESAADVSPSDPTRAIYPQIETAHSDAFVESLRRVSEGLPQQINLDSQNVEQGLVKLVLTLIEFIRRLLEKQAVRRMEGGALTPDQVEELGLTLMKLEAKMDELKAQFGLEDEDLNLDLGPLGRLT